VGVGENAARQGQATADYRYEIKPTGKAAKDIMTDDPKKELLSLLARIDQQIAEAASLSVTAIAEETVQWQAAMQLDELRNALQRVQELIEKNNERKP